MPGGKRVMNTKLTETGTSINLCFISEAKRSTGTQYSGNCTQLPWRLIVRLAAKASLAALSTSVASIKTKPSSATIKTTAFTAVAILKQLASLVRDYQEVAKTKTMRLEKVQMMQRRLLKCLWKTTEKSASLIFSLSKLQPKQIAKLRWYEILKTSTVNNLLPLWSRSMSSHYRPRVKPARLKIGKLIQKVIAVKTSKVVAFSLCQIK